MINKMYLNHNFIKYDGRYSIRHYDCEFECTQCNIIVWSNPIATLNKLFYLFSREELLLNCEEVIIKSIIE